jgi:hypothetical protein
MWFVGRRRMYIHEGADRCPLETQSACDGWNETAGFAVLKELRTDRHLWCTYIFVTLHAEDLHVAVMTSVSESCYEWSCLSEERRLCWFTFQFAPWQPRIRYTSVWEWRLVVMNCMHCFLTQGSGTGAGSFLHDFKGMAFHCVEITPRVSFPGYADSAMCLILGTKPSALGIRTCWLGCDVTPYDLFSYSNGTPSDWMFPGFPHSSEYS